MKLTRDNPFGVAEGAINKLPNLFRNFQAKLSLADGSLESPEMAPKKKRYTVSGILKLSGKNTEGYGGSVCCAFISFFIL